MPSLSIPLWLLLAATPAPDPLAPPSTGTATAPKTSPKKATDPNALPPPTVGTIPAAPRPGQTKVPKEPATPKATPVAKEPTATRAPVAPTPPMPPTPPANKPATAAKSPAPTKVAAPPAAQPAIDSTAEDMVQDTRPKKRGPRSKITIPEREEPVERKNVWGQERYAAVVPPALTLSALQNEMNKGARKTLDSGSAASSGSERERLEQLAADIEKARESLRQETARLEALLKASGNCGGGGGMGMLMGDPLSGAPQVSAASLREASNEQIDSVSKALKGMKPEQGAAVLARLDRGLAAEVLRRMRPVDAGGVMGLLKPELAAELATEIALRKPAAAAKEKKGAAK